MAQATAVQTKIAMIATMRFNMVVCVPTLSAAPPNLCPEVGHVKYFSLQSETGRNFGMQASVVCFCSGRSSDRYPMQRRPSQAGPSGSRARRGRILPCPAAPSGRRQAAFVLVAGDPRSSLRSGPLRPGKQDLAPPRNPERHDKGRHLAPQGAWARVVACAPQGELE